MPKAVGYIETMDCLPVSKLPEGPKWTYEIKLDGRYLTNSSSGVVKERLDIEQPQIPFLWAMQFHADTAHTRGADASANLLGAVAA